MQRLDELGMEFDQRMVARSAVSESRRGSGEHVGMKPSIRMMLASVVAAVAVATGGCSAEKGETPADRDDSWVSSTNRDIEEARKGGASHEQLRILEGGVKNGKVTFEEYSSTIDTALRCVREAGFQVFSDRVTVYQGLKMRLYTVQSRADGTQEPAVESCLKQHSYYAEKVYQLQPASIELKERHFEQFREALLSCLAEVGVAVDQQMTMDEILRAVGEGMDEGVDCLQKTGYDG